MVKERFGRIISSIYTSLCKFYPAPSRRDRGRGRGCCYLLHPPRIRVSGGAGSGHNPSPSTGENVLVGSYSSQVAAAKGLNITRSTFQGYLSSVKYGIINLSFENLLKKKRFIYLSPLFFSLSPIFFFCFLFIF